MHTQRINLLLTHDTPLALDSLIIPTRSNSDPSSTRLHFAQVECRRAFELLSQFLRNWCDFAVREKQMYVKFVQLAADPDSSGARARARNLFTQCKCSVRLIMQMRQLETLNNESRLELG